MRCDCGMRRFPENGPDCGFKRKRRLYAPLVRRPHSGMTLVELLVVITILVILLGAAIPLLSPASDARRLREASRGLNTFIAAAQMRATENGRPFGVAFKKLAQDTGSADDRGVCVEAYYVEQPAPYAGFDDKARVRLSLDPSNNQGGMRIQFVRFGDSNPPPENTYPLPPELNYDEIPSGLFRLGDKIQVAGRTFEFTDTTTSVDESGFYVSQLPNDIDELFIRPSDSPRVTTDATGSIAASLYYIDPDLNGSGVRANLNWTEPLRYKILRQPIRTSNAPYQLPEGTAIDLEASGFANGLRLYHPQLGAPLNAADVVVMFAPDGSISSVRNVYGPAGGQPLVETLVSSNLFLLLGLRENIPAPATDFYNFTGTDAEKQDEKAAINWLNGETRWVTVGAQTGAVVTAENAFVDPERLATMDLPDGDAAALAARRRLEINAAREIARQLTGVGGR